jgi:hypothetical protein
MESMDLLLIIAGSATAVFVLVGMTAIVWYIRVGFRSVDYRIKQSILPITLTISPPTHDIADLAIEFWRLDKRLSKIEDKLSADENKALQNSADKLRRFVQRNDVEVTDYTGQIYNEGMNVDVLSIEKDSELKQSIIFETHEPAISHKGILIRKAKVIIHEK